MRHGLIASNPLGEGHVLIERAVSIALEAYRQHKPNDTEAGGLLLGYRRGPHLHVVDLTEPFPTDRRTRTSFKRACAGHAEIAYERWRASGQHLDYLGEWHSHPEAHALPSAVDMREWQTLLQGRDTSMVFLVLGVELDWLGVGLGARIKRVKAPESGLPVPA